MKCPTCGHETPHNPVPYKPTQEDTFVPWLGLAWPGQMATTVTKPKEPK